MFKRLAKWGFEIDLYTARLKDGWPPREEIDGINVIRSPKTYGNFITKDGFRDISQVLEFTMWVLMRLMRDRGYDLIEANHCPILPAMISWIRSKLGKTPVTMTFHEVWHAEWYRYVPRLIYAPIGILLERALARLPDVSIAVSEFTARRLVELLGMKDSWIVVIPNGVDLKFIERVRVGRERQKIVYVGRLNPHKKVEWLLDAFKMLKAEFPEAKLEIIGDGPMRMKYVSYAERIGVRDVFFRGAVSDEEIVRSLKSSYVYVLPSIREGQSITTLEAMASGTPQVVVEADGSGAARLVAESWSGICVKPNPRAICEGIKRLMLDEEAWRAMSLNGYAYVSRMDWDNVAERHRELYESLARR